MDTQEAAIAALVGYGIFLVLAFGLRSLAHYRRTGSTGFVGVSGHAGEAAWWGGILFVVALIFALAAPLLQLAGVIAPFGGLDAPCVRALGAAFSLLGIGGTLWAQFAMGDSWRIGVDPQVSTALVQSGPFRWVRNPIFTTMTVATVGLGLLVPNLFSILACIALVLALEVQVRLVEEPYLARIHGDSYRRYGAQTGRFLPGVGRLAP